MINKDGGGTIFRFYEGGTELMGGSPVPTLHWGKPQRVNLNLSFIVSKAHCHDS